MKKKTIRDIDVAGKRVLVRVDYNVPMDKETGAIIDDSRIKATLPTIDYLRERGAKVILVSHLGQAKGRPGSCAQPRPDCRTTRRTPRRAGADRARLRSEQRSRRAAHGLEPGEVLMLENVRFHGQEEANDTEFAKALASLAEVYVNDAFGTAHRAHASTAGVARYLPAVAGFLMEKEIEYLGRAVANPERPYAAIIGGAKISTKMAVLESLLEKVDKLLIGGGMANTFLKAEGFNVGDSLVEEDYVAQAKDVMQRADEKGVRLLLPTDVIVADRFAADAQAKRVSVKDVPDGWMIMDVGETTIDVYARALANCKTIVWNGPMGVIEMGPFAHGSHRLAGSDREPERRDDDHRRRRDGGCRRATEPRVALLAREHRRRRIARVPRGAGSSGRDGAAGRLERPYPFRRQPQRRRARESQGREGEHRRAHPDLLRGSSHCKVPERLQPAGHRIQREHASPEFVRNVRLEKRLVERDHHRPADASQYEDPERQDEDRRQREQHHHGHVEERGQAHRRDPCVIEFVMFATMRPPGIEPKPTPVSRIPYPAEPTPSSSRAISGIIATYG